MDKKQIVAIKELIEAEKIKTKAKIVEFKELSKPVSPENAIGRISRMDAINNKSVAEAALRTQEEKLKGLDFALQNIETKDFGICAKCKQDIPIGRILLMPHNRFCVNCAS